jgi:hypothetical protein
MTPRTTRRLEAIGISLRAFARITGTRGGIVRLWGKDDLNEPAWVDHLVTAWETSPALRLQALDKARQAIEASWTAKDVAYYYSRALG